LSIFPEVKYIINSIWHGTLNRTRYGSDIMFETAWILLESANAIKHTEFISASREILISLCNNAIEKGFDKQYGGMFNRFQNDTLLASDKEWWPQAESVIAFLSAYHVSNDKKIPELCYRLLEYIDNTFSDQERVSGTTR